MGSIKTKKDVAKLLINNREAEGLSHEELIDMLLDSTVAVDVDKESESNKKFSDRAADKLTALIGTWDFIIMFSTFMVMWIFLNLFIINLDPFPFILLNLLLSCVAALQAPIIMMSQNKENELERKRNQNDYKVDLKSELILEVLYEQIEEIRKNQNKILKSLENKGSAKK